MAHFFRYKLKNYSCQWVNEASSGSQCTFESEMVSTAFFGVDTHSSKLVEEGERTVDF